MRVSSTSSSSSSSGAVLATILTAASSLIPSVAAAGRLGFALGVKQANGGCKVQGDYEADFDAIHQNSGATIVRVYSAADCDVVSQILPAAKNKAFQVVLGVWPEDANTYNTAKSAITSTAVNYKEQVYAITVGSESLYRGTYTADQLKSKVDDLRSAAPDFRYGTADSWNKYADGTADPLIPSLDIVLVNAFAYWQGAAIENAVSVFNDDINQAFARVKTAAGEKQIELWVGETGWPTEGTTYQSAVPSLQNAQTFYDNGVCKSHNAGTKVFYFEAFDEPWKPDSIGEDGNAADEKHWGAMNVDRTPKFPLRC